MKKRNILSGLLALCMALFILSSCSKDDPADEPEFKGLSLDTEQVLQNVPEGLKNSSDPYAIQCYSYIQSALDMSSFIGDMTPPDNARRSSQKATGEAWQWTVSDGMHSLTFYWEYEEDGGKNYWTMDIQIDGGPVYNYLYAWESKDGKQGQVQYNFNWIYAYEGYEGFEGYEDLYWTYDWLLDNEGSYTFNMSYDSDGEEVDYFLSYSVVLNDDGSGSVDYYTLDEHLYKMEWDVLGNGSWELYPGTENAMNGSWTV